MASGNVRQSGAIYRPLKSTTKVVQDHMVMEIDSDGNLVLADGAGTPYAVTTRSTKSKRKQLIGIDEYDTGANFPGQMKCTRSGLVDLALSKGHAKIVIGDKLVVDPTTSDGTVDKGSDGWGTNDHLCVAVAEEAVAVAASATTRQQETVKAYLNFVRLGGM